MKYNICCDRQIGITQLWNDPQSLHVDVYKWVPCRNRRAFCGLAQFGFQPEWVLGTIFTLFFFLCVLCVGFHRFLLWSFDLPCFSCRLSPFHFLGFLCLFSQFYLKFIPLFLFKTHAYFFHKRCTFPIYICNIIFIHVRHFISTWLTILKMYLWCIFFHTISIFFKYSWNIILINV